MVKAMINRGYYKLNKDGVYRKVQCVHCENEAKENSILELCEECLEKPVEELFDKVNS